MSPLPSVLAAALMAKGGPVGQSPEDGRLAALKAHQQALATEPDPPEKPSVLKAIAPLVMSEIADLLTTHAVQSEPVPRGWEPPKENNPIPGMGSDHGRIAMNALEAAVVMALLKKKPSLGGAVSNAISIGHGALASGNQAMDDDNRQIVMGRFPRRQ
jgi:hypothetical protein